MSTFFAIAADFIDRMTNPAYGVLVNQDYSLRFAELLKVEEDSIIPVFQREAKSLVDADVLTGSGWIWFLTLARSASIPLREDLLINIAEKFSSVFIQTLTIEVALLQGSEQRTPKKTEHFFEVEHPFLRRLLLNAVKVHEPSEISDSEGQRLRQLDDFRIIRAQSVLVSLLEIDSPITDSAARALLLHDWPGHKQFVEFYKYLLRGFDEDIRMDWESRIRL